MSNRAQPRKSHKKPRIDEENLPAPCHTERISQHPRCPDKPISFAPAAVGATSLPSDTDVETSAMGLPSASESEFVVQPPFSEIDQEVPLKVSEGGSCPLPEIHQDAPLNVTQGASNPMLDPDSVADLRALPEPGPTVTAAVQHLDPTASILRCLQAVRVPPVVCAPTGPFSDELIIRALSQIDPVILRDANEVFVRRDAGRAMASSPPVPARVSQPTPSSETIGHIATVNQALAAGVPDTVQPALVLQGLPTTPETQALTLSAQTSSAGEPALVPQGLPTAPEMQALTPNAQTSSAGGTLPVQQFLQERYSHQIALTKAVCRSRIIGKVVEQHIVVKIVGDSLDDTGVVKHSVLAVKCEDAFGREVWVQHDDVVDTFNVNRSTLSAAMTLFTKLEGAYAWLLMQEEDGPYEGDENDKLVLKDVQAICDHNGFIHHADIDSLLAVYHSGVLEAAVLSVLPSKDSPFLSHKLGPLMCHHNIKS
ncbi:unnamed protein product [Cyclocybe aegerita]|uniref:Uncharacterized protein n=1 Tax=Cyclocybe aegerita TaxID=1973307 RepID=A0A8S0W099_CYCAE|nr:unnamed protein product [Cyclocybe aegerita]